jgi:hypothetical protein
MTGKALKSLQDPVQFAPRSLPIELSLDYVLPTSSTGSRKI